MSKFTTFLALAFLVTISAIPCVSTLKIYMECQTKFPQVTVCNSDAACQTEYNTVSKCYVDQNCGKNDSLSDIASCTDTCNTATKDAVKNAFSYYSSCMNGKILTFATLLFSIFFMLF